jgi:hypothetical protein
MNDPRGSGVARSSSSLANPAAPPERQAHSKHGAPEALTSVVTSPNTKHNGLTPCEANPLFSLVPVKGVEPSTFALRMRANKGLHSFGIVDTITLFPRKNNDFCRVGVDRLPRMLRKSAYIRRYILADVSSLSRGAEHGQGGIHEEQGRRVQVSA